VEVWGTKGCFAETIDECSEWFTLFLPDAQEGDRSALMWSAASEMGWEHMGKSVEVVDGIGWKGCEPFKSGALEGGGEGFAKDCVLGRVEGDMGDVDFKMFVRVGFTGVGV